MTRSLLETLALLAGTGAALGACAPAQTTEVPAGPTPPCLHRDGCCGGHSPGDASCGEDMAAAKPDGEAASATSEAWAHTWTVAPGDMAEINLELGAGASMAAKFTTDGSTMHWNVHSHEGDEAIIHAEGTAASGQPRHTAAKPGMYSFLWRNAGEQPVRLTVELELGGAAKVHSTHPAR